MHHSDRSWTTILLLAGITLMTIGAIGRPVLDPGTRIPEQPPPDPSPAVLQPQRPSPVGAAVAPPETVLTPAPKAIIECTDIRTGIGFEYFARRVLATGKLDTAWVGADGYQCLGSSDDLSGVTCSDGTGGTFVGWVSTRDAESDVLLQHFSSTGQLDTGWPAGGLGVCRADGAQYNPDLAPDGAGGVYVVWQDFRNGGADIFAQHINGVGEVQWETDGRVVCAEPHPQACPHLAKDGASGVWFIWQDWRSTTVQLFGQHFGSSGAPVAGWDAGGESLLAPSGNVNGSGIASDSAGTALIVGRAAGETSASLYAISITSLDVPGAGWTSHSVALATGLTRLGDPAVVVAGRGPGLVAWTEQQGGDERVVLQALALSDANPLESWPAAGLTLTSSSVGISAPRILLDTDSSATIAWEDYRAGTSDIYVQRASLGGLIAEQWPENGLAVEVGAGEQYSPTLTGNGGGVLVAWADAASSARGTFAGAQSALVSEVRFARASAVPGRASVVWSAPRALRGIKGQRRLSGVADWTDLQAIAPNDSGLIFLEDRAAPDGASVEYRLAISADSDLFYIAPVALVVPVAPLKLALHHAWALPRQDAFALSLALPRGIAPSVELYDVLGRRLKRQSLNGLEPGEQIVQVQTPGRIASGIYFVRLSQGPQSRSAKLVYVR